VGISAVQNPTAQQFANGEIHDWYTIIWGFSDHLVEKLINRLGLSQRDRVLDPFCGTGTTLVECLKNQVSAVGVDANPASVLAARVKTDWSVCPTQLFDALDEVIRTYNRSLGQNHGFTNDATHRYLRESGMIDRGWISAVPLRKSLALKRAINIQNYIGKLDRALRLSLIAEVVKTASNVRFGPELYCGPRKVDAPVIEAFADRTTKMALDLYNAPRTTARADVLLGDAREVSSLQHHARQSAFDAVICSPPYPAEHDYTRNGRLELAFLEEVVDVQSLRKHKRRMMRSHTKNIYVDDSDRSYAPEFDALRALLKEVADAAAEKRHGFARLYEKVVAEYFGGMRRHLAAVRRVLKHNGACAYVVGDQASYAGVSIPTAELLATVAEFEGFSVEGIEAWRDRRSSGTGKVVTENILFLRNNRN